MKYLYSFLTFVVTFFVIISPGIKESWILESINIIIALICSIGLFSYQNNPFSMFKIFNIFFLFFFCIAPVLQFKNDVHFFGTLFQESDYIYTSFLLLIVLILFDLIYIISYSNYYKKHKYQNSGNEFFISLNNNKFSKSAILLMIILSGVSCFLMLWLNSFNIVSLFVRGGDMKDAVDVSNISSLILSNFVRPIPMIIFISALIFKLRNKLIILYLLLCLLFTCPPTGVARYTVAAVYLPVLFQVFPLFRKKNVFVISLVLALLIIFPLLNNFRYYDESTSLKLSLNFDQFLELHFDSYSMFMRVLKDNIITYGRQLLGVILFWVPRSIWPDKPVGSGYFVAETTGLSFNNISMPFFGEGYINFGIIGVVVFTVFLSLFVAKQDVSYWKNASNTKTQSWKDIKYYIYIGMFMFVLRGDLMSSFAFLCGYLFAYYFVKKILTKNMN